MVCLLTQPSDYNHNTNEEFQLRTYEAFKLIDDIMLRMELINFEVAREFTYYFICFNSCVTIKVRNKYSIYNDCKFEGTCFEKYCTIISHSSLS